MTDTASDWSIRTWKQRHENGYFPNSEQHRDWLVYEHPPEWLIEFGNPQPHDRVLEVGCGYGEWMIPLAPLVEFINGIDIHLELAKKAYQKFRECGIENARFVLSDGLSIPFPENYFSLVYSISVLQHLPRSIVHGYLKESARVVQSHGRVLHHFRNADNVGPYPVPAKDIEVNHQGDFSVGWTAAEVMEAGENAGLKSQVLDIGLFLILYGVRE